MVTPLTKLLAGNQDTINVNRVRRRNIEVRMRRLAVDGKARDLHGAITVP